MTAIDTLAAVSSSQPTAPPPVQVGGIRINREITISTLASTVVAVIGIIVGYSTLQNDTSNLKDRITKLDARVETLSQGSIQIARLDERMVRVADELQRVASRLDRILDRTKK